MIAAALQRHVVRRDGRYQRCTSVAGCEVDVDGSTDCCEQACPHCGIGEHYTVREGPGGVFTHSCRECESEWKT